MKESAMRMPLHGLIAAIVLAIGCVGPVSADDAKDPATKPMDVKSVFRNVCGFCHSDYGRHTGKGPQLMNSARTDEYLFDRIKNGKPGRMAAFGSIYSDEQIQQMVTFIRSLKPDEEPRNP